MKDPLCFVRAAIRLLQAGRPYRFIIAGDGGLRGEVLNLLEGSGAASSFDVLGMLRLEDIPYDQARVFVSTSLNESSSNSILEALAKGTPVVATGVGGSAELLRARPFASLAKPQDTDGIAAAIDHWLKLPDTDWQAASAAAMHFVRERFAVAKMVSRYAEFYKWAFDLCSKM